MIRIQKLASDMGYAFIGNAVHKLLAFLIIAVLARYIAKPEMGEFFLASGVAAIVAMFTELGTSRYLVRTIARDQSNAGRYLGDVLWLRMPLLMLALVMTASIVWWLGLLSLTIFLPVCAYILIGDLYFTYGAVLIARRAIVLRVVTILTGPAILLLIVVAGYMLNWSFELILWLHVASSLVTVAVAAAVVHYIAGISIKRPEKGVSIGLMASSWPFFALTLLAMAHARAAEIILAALRNYEDVASYAAAYKLLEVSRFVIRPVAMVLFPVFAAAALSDTWVEQRENVRRLILGSAGVGIVMAVFVIATAAVIVPFVFGMEYQSSIQITRILFVATPALFVTQAALLIALAFDMEHPAIVITFFGLLVNTCLNVLLIPDWGPVGAAQATLASESILAVALLVMIGLIGRRRLARDKRGESIADQPGSKS